MKSTSFLREEQGPKGYTSSEVGPNNGGKKERLSCTYQEGITFTHPQTTTFSFPFHPYVFVNPDGTTSPTKGGPEKPTTIRIPTTMEPGRPGKKEKQVKC